MSPEVMRRWIHTVVNAPRKLWLAILAVYVTCSWTYALLEGKGPIEGLWWGIVTGSTVGYGDFYPESTAGRGVGAVLICSMLVLVPIAIGHIIAGFVVQRDAYTHEEQVQARQCDDETNHLVKYFITRFYGADELERVLEEFNTNRKEPSA
jgi:hypothetical protein